jgi:alkylglycerol monooxygenase
VAARRAAREDAAMASAQIIVLATPLFLGLIALEWWVGRRRGRDTYRVNDALASIGLGVTSQIAALFGQAVLLGIYTLAYRELALLELSAANWWVWLLALLLYDFCYYWNHRVGHRSAVFWAAHVVHHQSEDYNLSAALRQPSSYFLLNWIFYLPMAVLGIPPLVYAVVALVDLLYQYWVHTQQIGALGWFDRWFCAPSNHRVHHAVNDRYVDRNYGGILLVWDHLFGSWQPERADEACVYGSRAPLHSWDPIAANLQVYAALWHDSRHAASWTDKLRVWLKPPGWRPADVAQRFPKPAFELARVQRWDPSLPAGRARVCLAVFALLLAATSVLLWTAHRLPPAVVVALGLLIVAGLCGVARLSLAGPEAARATAAEAQSGA